MNTIPDLREALRAARVQNKRIGFVPTMGAFHEGHLQLMYTARAECDVTVVSLFVNPTQFGDPSDLANYPRDAERDQELASSAGVDVLFIPSVAEMYPPGFHSAVEVSGSTEPLEGAARGVAHFRGVATVVCKLLNIVQPHTAYFGQKDAQQTVVVRQLVRDLNIPVEIAVCPTLRESDGLAMSSRNALLSPEARTRAPALYESLTTIQQSAAHGERRSAVLLAKARNRLHERGVPDADIEYFAAVNSVTLSEVVTLGQSESTTAAETAPTLFALAVRVGGVRLIDNILVPANSHESSVRETNPGANRE